LTCALEEYVIRSTHKHKPHLYALPSSSFALWEKFIDLSLKMPIPYKKPRRVSTLISGNTLSGMHS